MQNVARDATNCTLDPLDAPKTQLFPRARNQTGIVLAAGSATIARIPQLAEAVSPALTLDLESRLQAAKPLAPVAIKVEGTSILPG